MPKTAQTEELVEMSREDFEKLPQDLYGLPQYFSDFDGERHVWPKELGGKDSKYYALYSQTGKVIGGKISLKDIKSLWSKIQSYEVCN